MSRRVAFRFRRLAEAVAESFFGTLETELLYELPLRTYGTTQAAVADYIEAFYNARRHHSVLGYVSPLEFELQSRRGELGGFAHEPPFIAAPGRDLEEPGLTA